MCRLGVSHDTLLLWIARNHWIHPHHHTLLSGLRRSTAGGKRPVPSRTRKLSPPAPTVLHSLGCGRLGHRRTTIHVRPHSDRCGALRIPENPHPTTNTPPTHRTPEKKNAFRRRRTRFPAAPPGASYCRVTPLSRVRRAVPTGVSSADDVRHETIGQYGKSGRVCQATCAGSMGCWVIGCWVMSAGSTHRASAGCYRVASAMGCRPKELRLVHA
jgi:hypothetical protein